MSNLFDSTSYYLIASALYGIDTHLSDGLRTTDATNGLSLGSAYSYTSENWQVFFQNGVYFIRNYDYGAKYQLGISADSRTQPRLIATSGDLSQQWNITKWSDGTLKLTNMEVGELQMLGVSNDTNSVIIPVLNPVDEGSHWIFDINSSAGDASEAMLQPLSSVATVPSTASSTALSTSSTTSATSSPSKSSSAPTSQATAVASSSGTSHTLSSGGLAGVIVGAIVLVAIAISCAFFLIRRRRRARDASHRGPLKDAAMQEKSRPSELKGDFPPAELPIQKESRYTEMPS